MHREKSSINVGHMGEVVNEMNVRPRHEYMQNTCKLARCIVSEMESFPHQR